MAVGTLSTRVTSQLQSLQGLHLRLRDIGQYLQKVLKGQLPVNHAILGNLQDVFNLLPNLSTPKTDAVSSAEGGGDAARTDNSELARAMSVKINDQLMTIYLSSLIRAITAFHDLIDNKIQNRQQQEEKEAKKEEGKDGSASSSSGKKGANGAGAANGEPKGPSGANDDDEAEGGKDKEKDKDGRERRSPGTEKKQDGKGGGNKR